MFLNRMLQLLRNNKNSSTVVLTSEFNKDLHWFTVFLKSYNGVTIYHVTDELMHLTASLQGLVGHFKNYVYSISFPLNFI